MYFVFLLFKDNLQLHAIFANSWIFTAVEKQGREGEVLEEDKEMKQRRTEKGKEKLLRLLLSPIIAMTQIVALDILFCPTTVNHYLVI